MLSIHNRSTDPAYRYTLQASATIGVGSTGTVTADASLGAALVQLSGSFAAGDRIVLNAGGVDCGITVGDSNSLDLIAQLLANAINSNPGGSAVLAALSASAAGRLRDHREQHDRSRPRAARYRFP